MKIPVVVAIDYSLRSSGIVVLDHDNNLIDQKIISSYKPNDEELLFYIIDSFRAYINSLIREYDVTDIIIEGISFGGKSGCKDLITTGFWLIRMEWFYSNINIHIVPVKKWRCKFLTPAETNELKEEHGKLAVKVGIADKIEPDVRKKFEKYISKDDCWMMWDKKKDRMKKKGKDKNPLYDLADAYFIGKWFNIYSK